MALVGPDGLEGGLGDALAEEDGVLLAAVPLVGRGQDALGFGRQSDVGGFADAELLQPVMALVLGQALAHHDRAGVHGVADDSGQRPLLGAVFERVAEGLAVHGVGRRNGEGVQRAGLAFLDHGGGRDHLLHRAGLVGGGDRPDAAVLGGNLAGVVGIRGVGIGHGNDVAGLGVGDDDDAPFGAELVRLALDRLLGEVLEVRIQRELDVLAVHRRRQLVHAHRDAQSVGADFKQALAGSSLEDLVLGLFESRLAGGAVLQEARRSRRPRSRWGRRACWCLR